MQIIDVRKLWDKAPHNAFTDLVHFKGHWFCVFREGSSHVSPDGAIRIIKSLDGHNWVSATRIESEVSDLRDPKLTVRPDGQLMLSCAEALHDKTHCTHRSLVWHSPDGSIWSDKTTVGDANFWLWRHTWHDRAVYSIGYDCGKGEFVRLYRSQDGRKYVPINSRLFDVGSPNETSLVFRGSHAYCLLRRDGSPDTALLGTSIEPYTEWEWKDLGKEIGGPHMAILPDGRCISVVRLYDDKVRTAVCEIDLAKGKLTELFALPSGKDTSYAGIVVHGKELWISYYSSHEGISAVYLARVLWSTVLQ